MLRAKVEIIDNNGRKVRSFEMSAKTQQMLLPLQGISKGLYLIKVIYEGYVLGTEKLTILD